MFTYRAKVERVVDGDTVDLILDLGFDIHYSCRVRLLGVNAPESRTKDLKEKEKGLAAKAYVQDWFDGHPEVYVQTYKDAKGKYGRILANIFADMSLEVCLNEQLVDSGHAVEYFGGKR
jgi:micrococcal nuclease